LAEWNIEVKVDGEDVFHSCNFQDFENWIDEQIPVDEYVPGKEGEAVLLTRLLQELSLSGPYESVLFQAEDGFIQQVEMDQLTNAFFLIKQKGEPLKKGFPARLYVPSSTSDCLNVKSVVRITLKPKLF
jgi:DMSO/TMAO reductase YedYZ molybdopterin-dependent catalytic subunit